MRKLVSKEKTLLECACGRGVFTEILAERCKTVIATDYSKIILLQAKKKYGACKNVSFQVGNILEIQFPEESLYTVVAANHAFFTEVGYQAVKIRLIKVKISCAVALIKKK